MREPNYVYTDDMNPTANRVLDLLASHGVEPAEAADALQSLYWSVSAVASNQYGVGKVPLEALADRLLASAFDASYILSSLGAPGTNLEFRLVLPTPEERRWVGCLHESAHAVVGHELLGPSAVEWISVNEEDLRPGDMYGVTQLSRTWGWIQNWQRRPTDDALRAAVEPKALALAATTLAGAYGVGAVLTDRFPSFGTDLSEARNLCGLFAPAGEGEAAFRLAHRDAARLVGTHRAAIFAVATELARVGRMTGTRVGEVIELTVAHPNSADRRASSCGTARPAPARPPR